MPTELPLWALAFAAGIFTGDALGTSATSAELALCAAALLTAAGLRRSPWSPVVLRAATLVTALCLGALAQASRPQPAPIIAQLDGPVPRDDLPLLFAGQARAAPVSGGFAQGHPRHSVRLSLDLVRPTPGGPWRQISPPVSALALIRGAPREALWPGDRVVLRGRLRPARGLRNPGDEDAARRAAATGLDATVSVEPDALVRLVPAHPREWLHLPPDLVVLRAVALARARLLSFLRATLAPDPAGGLDEGRSARPRAIDAYALLAALCLGERGALAEAAAHNAAQGLPAVDMEQVFRDAGIFHVLSVSGLHLAAASLLIFYGLQGVLLLLQAGHAAAQRTAALLSLPAVLFYTLLTGAEVATVRATVVACCWLVGLGLGRRGRLGEALGAAGLLLLAWAPLQLFDPAFQLSVAATWGTSCLRPLRRFLQQAAEDPAADAVARAARWALRLLDATLGATLATAPLCALHFAELQGAGPVGNLLVVPLGELVVLPLGLLGLAVGSASPALGAPVLRLAGWAAQCMLALTQQIASWGASVHAPAPSAWALLLWAIGLLLLAYRTRSWAVWCALGAALWLVQTGHGRLEVTFLDVGQGDAAVLELPGGQVVVVDGGNGPGEVGPAADMGERVLVPLLRRRGHRRISVVVASHPHPDHVGGLAALLERFPVGELWAAEGPALEAADRSWQQVLEAAALHGVPVRRPRRLELGGVTLVPLWPCAVPAEAAPTADPVGPAGPVAPPEGDADRDGPDGSDQACSGLREQGLRHNDNSVVLLLRYAGRSLLLPGDIERAGEAGLLERGAAGRVDILKAPHHCSKTSSTAALLASAAPQVAVCSVGWRNRYGFPHAQVVARYEGAGTRLLRTDLDGAVQIRISHGGALEVTTARPRPAP